MSVDLMDAYFHIQVALHHMRFLMFALEGIAYQYTVLLFELNVHGRGSFPPSERAGCTFFSITWMNPDLSSVKGRQPYIQTASSLMELLRLCGNEYA